MKLHILSDLHLEISSEILQKHTEGYRLAGHPLHVQDNDAIVIDRVCVIGSTLWTDMELHNNADEMKAKHLMNDYHKIVWDVGKSLTPAHTIQRRREISGLSGKDACQRF